MLVELTYCVNLFVYSENRKPAFNHKGNKFLDILGKKKLKTKNTKSLQKSLRIKLCFSYK